MRTAQVWKQRDGTPIPIAAMTDEHIFKALRMLRRRGERGTERHRALLAEVENRWCDERAGMPEEPADILDVSAAATDMALFNL